VERKDMSQEALMDYHLYTLDRSTSLANNQSKQVAMFSGRTVPVSKSYQIDGQQQYFSNDFRNSTNKLNVNVYLEFDNTKKSNLGMPLPEGVMRVYKKDSHQNAQFVGEDRIEHTASDEHVRLKMGKAFDITARKTQTDFKKIASDGRHNFVFESAYKYEIHNSKPEDVTVLVSEAIPGDWQILDESHKHAKKSASQVEWTVPISAKKTATLSYKVRVRY